MPNVTNTDSLSNEPHLKFVGHCFIDVKRLLEPLKVENPVGAKSIAEATREMEKNALVRISGHSSLSEKKMGNFGSYLQLEMPKH